MKKEIKLTSVKIIESLYNNFKVKTVNSNMNLQKLVNRSMDLYLIDNDFKTQIHDWKNLKPSGSRL